MFRELFPDEDVPEAIGAHCSSQFAVSREQIQKRPKADYERYRQWILDTDLDDQISGRVIEYMWHSEFFDDSTGQAEST